MPWWTAWDEGSQLMGVGCTLFLVFPPENGHREQALENGGLGAQSTR